MKFEPLLNLGFILVFFAPIIAWLIWDIIQKLRKKRRPFHGRSYWRVLAILVLLGVICAGPSVPGEKSPAGMVNLDVLLVIDCTASISAEDYGGQKPRLDGIKSDLGKLLDKIKGARVALITFDSTAATINLPFTSDSSSASTAIKTLDQEIAIYSNGSSIDMPIDAIEKLLNQSKTKYPSRGRLVFYASDGEQTANKLPRSFSSIKELVDGGAVLGYGTISGGKMPTYYGFQGYDDYIDKYIKDLSKYSASGYPDAISKIDEVNLKKIASDIGVKYLHRTSEAQSMDEIIKGSNLAVIGDSHREIKGYISLYWIFAIIIVLLLVWWLLEIWKPIQFGIKKEVS